MDEAGLQSDSALESSSLSVTDQKTLASASNRNTQTLRDYQRVLVELAKEHNVIVQLETGQGKTLIGIHVVIYFADKLARLRAVVKSIPKLPADFLPRQLIVFLVPKVVLCRQQSKYISAESGLQVGELFGELGVDLWTDEQLDAWLKQYDVICATAGVFKNLLRASRISMLDIALLVFDECHQATGDSDYAIIMDYYASAKRMVQEAPSDLGLDSSVDSLLVGLPSSIALELRLAKLRRPPRILGLTASAASIRLDGSSEIWISKARAEIEKLEQRLDSKLVVVPAACQQILQRAPVVYQLRTDPIQNKNGGTDLTEVLLYQNPAVYEAQITQPLPEPDEYTFDREEELILQSERFLRSLAAERGLIAQAQESRKTLTPDEGQASEQSDERQNLASSKTSTPFVNPVACRSVLEVLGSYDPSAIFPPREGGFPPIRALAFASATSETHVSAGWGSLNNEAKIFHYILPAQYDVFAQVASHNSKASAEALRNGEQSGRVHSQFDICLEQVACEAMKDSIELDASARNRVIKLLEFEVQQLLEYVGVFSSKQWQMIDRCMDGVPHSMKLCSARDDLTPGLKMLNIDSPFELSEKVLLLARILNYHSKQMLLHCVALKRRFYFRGPNRLFRFSEDCVAHHQWLKWIVDMLGVDQRAQRLGEELDAKGVAESLLATASRVFPSHAIIFTKSRADCARLHHLFERSPLFAPARALKKAAFIIGQSGSVYLKLQQFASSMKLEQAGAIIAHSSEPSALNQMIVAGERLDAGERSNDSQSIALFLEDFFEHAYLTHSEEKSALKGLAQAPCHQTAEEEPCDAPDMALPELAGFASFRGMSMRKQREIVSSFANGAIQVLFSTAVAEEGLDVTNCDLVIMFDGVENVQKYVQRRGRARARNAVIVIFNPKVPVVANHFWINSFDMCERSSHFLKQLRLQYKMLRELFTVLGERNRSMLEELSQIKAVYLDDTQWDADQLEPESDLASARGLLETLQQTNISASPQLQLRLVQWVGQGSEDEEAQYMLLVNQLADRIGQDEWEWALRYTPSQRRSRLRQLELARWRIGRVISEQALNNSIAQLDSGILALTAVRGVTYSKTAEVVTSDLFLPPLTALHDAWSTIAQLSKVDQTLQSSLSDGKDKQGAAWMGLFRMLLQARMRIMQTTPVQTLDQAIFRELHAMAEYALTFGTTVLTSISEQEEKEILLSSVRLSSLPTLLKLLTDLPIRERLCNSDDSLLSEGNVSDVSPPDDELDDVALYQASLHEKCRDLVLTLANFFVKWKGFVGLIRLCCLLQLISLRGSKLDTLRTQGDTFKTPAFAMLIPLKQEESSQSLQEDMNRFLPSSSALSLIWQTCAVLSVIIRQHWMDLHAGPTLIDSIESLTQLIEESSAIGTSSHQMYPHFECVKTKDNSFVCRMTLRGPEIALCPRLVDLVFESSPAPSKQEAKQIAALLCLGYLCDLGIFSDKWVIDAKYRQSPEGRDHILALLSSPATRDTTSIAFDVHMSRPSASDSSEIVKLTVRMRSTLQHPNPKQDDEQTQTHTRSTNQRVEGTLPHRLSVPIIDEAYAFRTVRFRRMHSRSSQTQPRGSCVPPTTEDSHASNERPFYEAVVPNPSTPAACSLPHSKLLSVSFDEIELALGIESGSCLKALSGALRESQPPVNVVPPGLEQSPRHFIQSLLTSRSPPIYYTQAIRKGESSDREQHLDQAASLWSWKRGCIVDHRIALEEDQKTLHEDDTRSCAANALFAALTAAARLHKEGQLKCSMIRELFDRHPDLWAAAKILDYPIDASCQRCLADEALKLSSQPPCLRTTWHLYYLYLVLPCPSSVGICQNVQVALLPQALLLPKRLPPAIEESSLLPLNATPRDAKIFPMHALSLISGLIDQISCLGPKGSSRNVSNVILYLKSLYAELKACEHPTPDQLIQAQRLSARCSALNFAVENASETQKQTQRVESSTRDEIARMIVRMVFSQNVGTVPLQTPQAVLNDPTFLKGILEPDAERLSSHNQTLQVFPGLWSEIRRLATHIHDFFASIGIRTQGVETGEAKGAETVSVPEPSVSLVLFVPVVPFRMPVICTGQSIATKAVTNVRLFDLTFYSRSSFRRPLDSTEVSPGSSELMKEPRTALPTDPIMWTSPSQLFLRPDVRIVNSALDSVALSECKVLVKCRDNAPQRMTNEALFSIWGLGYINWTHVSHYAATRFISTLPIDVLMRETSTLKSDGASAEHSGVSVIPDGLVSEPGDPTTLTKYIINGSYRHTGVTAFLRTRDSRSLDYGMVSFSPRSPPNEGVILPTTSRISNQAEQFILGFCKGRFLLIDVGSNSGLFNQPKTSDGLTWLQPLRHRIRKPRVFDLRAAAELCAKLPKDVPWLALNPSPISARLDKCDQNAFETLIQDPSAPIEFTFKADTIDLEVDSSVEPRHIDDLLTNSVTRSYIFDQLPAADATSSNAISQAHCRWLDPVDDGQLLTMLLRGLPAEFSAQTIELDTSSEILSSDAVHPEFHLDNDHSDGIYALHGTLAVGMRGLDALFSAMFLHHVLSQLEWQARVYEALEESGWYPLSVGELHSISTCEGLCAVYDWSLNPRRSSRLLFALATQALNPIERQRKNPSLHTEAHDAVRRGNRFELLESVGDALLKLTSVLALSTQVPSKVCSALLPVSAAASMKDYINSNAHLARCITRDRKLLAATRTNDEIQSYTLPLAVGSPTRELCSKQQSEVISSISLARRPELLLPAGLALDAVAVTAALHMRNIQPHPHFGNRLNQIGASSSWVSHASVRPNRLYASVCEALLGALVMGTCNTSAQWHEVEAANPRLGLLHHLERLNIYPDPFARSIREFMKLSANTHESKELDNHGVEWICFRPTPHLPLNAAALPAFPSSQSAPEIDSNCLAHLLRRFVTIVPESATINPISTPFPSLEHLDLPEDTKMLAQHLIAQGAEKCAHFVRILISPLTETNRDLNWLVSAALKDQLLKGLLQRHLEEVSRKELDVLAKRINSVLGFDETMRWVLLLRCSSDVQSHTISPVSEFESLSVSHSDGFAQRLALLEGPSLLTLAHLSVFKHLQQIERTLGYAFKVPALLAMAFVHSSICDAHSLTASSPDQLDKELREYGLGYKRLEFIGDAILDWLITVAVSTAVCNHTQSHALHPIDQMQTPLWTQNSSYPRNPNSLSDEGLVTWFRSKLGSTLNLALVTGFHRWCPLIACRGDSLKQNIREFQLRCLKIAETRTLWTEQELRTLQPPKVCADVIEAIIGAVYVDSGGSLSACWGVAHNLLGPFSSIINRVVVARAEP